MKDLRMCEPRPDPILDEMKARLRKMEESPEALSRAAAKLAVLAQDPILNALKSKLREIALAHASRKERAVGEVDVRTAEKEAQVAQAEIFLAIQDEQQNRRSKRYEHESEGEPEHYKRQRELRKWKVAGEPFDIDSAARLVRIGSLRLGIRSRRHSEEEAIEASKGLKYESLASIERRAVEIVLGRRRAPKNNRSEPAARIASLVRSEWIPQVPSLRPKKGVPISIAPIVRIAVPILDKLAGRPIASGIPTYRDLHSMKPAGVAALFAIVQLEYGKATPLESVYEALLEFRREQWDSDVTY
jgi:hypothetical protein